MMHHDSVTEEEKIHLYRSKIFDTNTFALLQLSGPVVEYQPSDWEVVGSNPGWVIPKTVKMAPIASLLSTQHQGFDLGTFREHNMPGM